MKTPPFRSVAACGLFSAVTFAGVSGAQDAATNPPASAPPGTFPFAMPWDDATPTVIDASSLNPAPITDQNRVTVKNGHFYDATGRRVRFLGVNFVYSFNFPDKATADKVAARLHKFGINLVRLHHMDTLRAPNGILSADAKDTRTIDPAQLDRLDYLVSALKRNGVYVDLNLHVGRQFNAADGFEDAGALPNAGKGLLWFEPHMIELQKEYAKALLDHVNPYTKLKYSQDPEVALVEINNEDTILGANRSQLLHDLPDLYRAPLQAGWNKYLAAKYPTTAAMLTAWNADTHPYGANQLQNADFAQGTTGWAAAGGDLAAVPAGPNDTGGQGQILQLTPAGAAAEITQSGLAVKRGTLYRVRFWAKSALAGTSAAVGVLSTKGTGIGAGKTVYLGTNWTEFQVPFKAFGDAANTSLSFKIKGAAGSDVSLRDLAFQEGDAVEIPAGQTLENANLELPILTPTVQGTDLEAYLMTVEANYVATMRGYIKGDLGTQAQVTCSQGAWGGMAGLVRESVNDYEDMHEYWDLPDTPGKLSDPHGTIDDLPLVRSTIGGSLTELALARLAGKPYTVSEYNEPELGDFGAETMPMLAAYAAWQDWDGVFLFEYDHFNKNLGKDYVAGWLDVDNDPARMAYMPAAARIFLGGDIRPAPNALTLQLPRANAAAEVAHGGLTYMTWAKAGVSQSDLTLGRGQVELLDAPGAVTATRDTPAPSPAIVWTTKDPTTATFRANGSGTRVLVGFSSNAWADAGGWGITIPNPTFASVTLCALDGKPLADAHSLLLTAASRFANQDILWNPAHTELQGTWGHGPILAQGVSGTVTLATHLKTASVYALDVTGKRAGTVPSRLAGGQLSFEIGPKDGTVWYEISVG